MKSASLSNDALEADPDFRVDETNRLSDSADFLIYGNSAQVLLLATFMLMFTPAVMGASQQTDPFEWFILRASMLSAAVIAYIIETIFSGRLCSQFGFKAMVCVGMVCTPMVLAGSAIEGPILALVPFWVLSGIGFTCLMILNVRFLSCLSHARLIASTSISFALATLLACLMAFLAPDGFRLLVIACMPIGSALFSLVNDSLNKTDHQMISSMESRARFHTSQKGAAAVISNSMFLGFSLFLVGWQMEMGSYWALPVVTCCIFASAIIAVSNSVAGSGWMLDEGVQLRFTVPLAMVSALPMFLLGPYGPFISCCLFMTIFVVQAITNVNAISESIRLDKMNFVHMCSFARPVNVTGLIIGYACGFGFLLLQDAGRIHDAMVVMFIMLTLVAFFSSTFFMNRYPGLPLPEEEEEPFRPVSSEQKPEHLSWKQRCYAFSESIGLSPRQKEVFILLTRGHNASYIERKLVISNHTVKSHTYSIYQKAHVHSRQELIERVESFEPSE